MGVDVTFSKVLPTLVKFSDCFVTFSVLCEWDLWVSLIGFSKAKSVVKLTILLIAEMVVVEYLEVDVSLTATMLLPKEKITYWTLYIIYIIGQVKSVNSGINKCNKKKYASRKKVFTCIQKVWVECSSM